MEISPLDKAISTPAVFFLYPQLVCWQLKSLAYMLGGGNTGRDAMVIWEEGGL